MSDECVGRVGFCRFCGQGVRIGDEAFDSEIELNEASQEELDELATDRCKCLDAKLYHDKKLRQERIDEYIVNEFTPKEAEAIEKNIELIEEKDEDQGKWLEATIKAANSGWTIKIKKDKCDRLIIEKKRTVKGNELAE